MRGEFFYTIGASFASGIFLRSFFIFNIPWIVFFIVIGSGLVVSWKMSSSQSLRKSPLFILGIAFLALASGIFWMQRAEEKVSPFSAYENQEVTLVARVVREPEVRDKNIQVYVAPSGDSEFSHERILVSTDRYAFHEGQLSYGDLLEIRGKITQPEAFETDIGRTFDYPGYLKSRGVIYQIPFAKVTIEREEEGTLLGAIFRGKQKFVEVIEYALPEPHAGLGEGMLLGIKRALGKDLEDTFRETGIIHIVVLSGYNIMIVVECLLFFLSFFFFPRTRMIVGIAGIILFALLVGLSATVVRASVMAGLLLVARGTGRIYTALRALILAGIIMLIHNPYLLVHDPGFQLSFLATLGLILFSPHVEKHLTLVPEKFGLRMVTTATIATQIAVLPLLLYQMGMVSLVSIFVNILVLPMVPVAMGLTFLTGVVGFFSEIFGTVTGFITYVSLGYIITIAQLFGALPFASLSVAVFPFWVVLCMYGAIGIVYVIVSNQDRSVEDVDIDTDTVNAYEGWVIEEEKEEPTEGVQSNSSVGPLPFR